MDDEKIQEELQFLLEEDSRVVSLWRVRFSFFSCMICSLGYF